MRARDLVLAGVVGAVLLAPGCKDDPLEPPTTGNLTIRVTFDTSEVVVPRPPAAGPANAGARFSSQAITSGEVWITRDGSTVQNFGLTLQGNALRGTSAWANTLRC